MAGILQFFAGIVFVLLLFSCSSKPSGVKSSLDTQGSLDIQAARLVENAKNLYLRGEYPKVVSHLESYFAIDPDADSGGMSNILFYCYLHMGKYEQAHERARNALSQSPHDSMAYTHVGLSQLWLNQAKLAVQSFQRALEFDSRSPLNHFYLSLAYEKLGQFKLASVSADQAEEELSQILTANPNDVRANYGLAEVYLYREKENARVAEIIGRIEKALSTDADEDIADEKKLYLSFYLPLIQGKHLSQLGAYEESNHSLLKAIEGAPSGIQADLAEIYFYFSKNYQAMNKLDSALNFLMRAERMDPTGPYLTRIKEIKLKIGRTS